MNKQECKKYIRRAYKKIIDFNKSLNEQIEEYIAYSKIAVHNMKHSGNIEITLKDLLSQVDILPKIYTKFDAITASKKL